MGTKIYQLEKIAEQSSTNQVDDLQKKTNFEKAGPVAGVTSDQNRVH